MTFINGWYALYVKSRWEKKVYESLKEICLDTFWFKQNGKDWISADKHAKHSPPVFLNFTKLGSEFVLLFEAYVTDKIHT